MVSVRAPDPGDSDSKFEDKLLQAARDSVQKDGAEVIVLGCAGLTGMDKSMEKDLGIPVLDGIVCALIIASGLVKYGVSTSKFRRYNPDLKD